MQKMRYIGKSYILS